MFKLTKTGINFFKFLIFIILFILIQLFMYQYSKQNPIKSEINENMMKNEVILNEKTIEKTIEKTEKWQLQIDKIGLLANISEGTTKEILSKNIGHFTQTSKEDGNIGLAAHNRGYEINYFEKLKLLKEGDEIKYIYNNYEKIYVVTKNIIIKDTDWEHLEDTEKNQITLITCVENEPEYRRCVKAIEKEEEIY